MPIFPSIPVSFITYTTPDIFQKNFKFADGNEQNTYYLTTLFGAKLTLEFKQLTLVDVQTLLNFWNSVGGLTGTFKLPSEILKNPETIQALVNSDSVNWQFENPITIDTFVATTRNGLWQTTINIKSTISNIPVSSLFQNIIILTMTTNLKFCEVIYCEDYQASTIIGTITDLIGVTYILNRKTNSIFVNELGSWLLFEPDEDLVLVNKRTYTFFQYISGEWIYFNNTFNVQDFGARGNGTTDDTEAFNACKNAAVNYSKFQIPKGVYVISSEITFNKTLEIVGDGVNTTVLLRSGNGNTLNFTYDNTTISDLTIKTVSGNSGKAMSFNGYSYKVTRILIDGNWNTAIYGKNMWESAFDSCSIIKPQVIGGETGFAFYFDHSVNISFVACHVYFYDYGIYTSNVVAPFSQTSSEGKNFSGGGNYSEGFSLCGCYIVACRQGIYAERITLLSLSSCVIDYNVLYGIRLIAGLSANISNSWIAGTNEFFYPGAEPIIISSEPGFSNFNLTGCTIFVNSTLTGSKALQLSGDYSTVTGNGFRCPVMGTLSGIGNTVNSNSFSGNASTSDLITNSTAGTESYDNIVIKATGNEDPNARLVFRTVNQNWNIEAGESTSSFRIVDLANGLVKCIINAGTNGTFTINTIAKINTSFVPIAESNVEMITNGFEVGTIYRGADGNLKIVY